MSRQKIAGYYLQLKGTQRDMQENAITDAQLDPGFKKKKKESLKTALLRQ